MMDPLNAAYVVIHFDQCNTVKILMVEHKQGENKLFVH